MEENLISRTALLAAIYRAYHSMQDDNKIFDDFLAKSILGDKELVSFKQQMVAGFFNPQLAATPLILSRSRYTEDCLEKVSAGSTVIFEYLDTDAFNPERSAQRVQLLLKLANQEKEPMQAGFDPSTLAVDLSRLGLHLKEDLGPSDIQKLYFENRKDKYYACEHAHLACAVVK